ncbi:hypothetical protein K7X08_007785 [Anisodus acutangulus]|uniref:Uncharacterized protein n=1 Tax=Anisodus acutangulus TaxID=402998 RepID=A0A9Q1MUV5_9SOLA|nr:hypothetical protein K7X08_007785 [Anisodus acutangulus]
MTKQIVLFAPSSISVDRRRQPLLSGQDSSSRGGFRKARFAEVAGVTAAECTAVFCCCPCGLVNLLVLAVYKLPAGLCRKALRRKRRRRLMKKGLLQPKGQCGCDDSEGAPLAVVDGGSSLESDKDVVALEKEQILWCWILEKSLPKE